MPTENHGVVQFSVTPIEYEYLKDIAEILGIGVEAFARASVIDALTVYIRAHREELIEKKREQLAEIDQEWDAALRKLLDDPDQDESE